ncbi:galactokinase family protein [Corynebacterium sp. CCM 9203]|uniref:galactokinase family protein n=1 Tax=Corynebacterium sp. CCM 9203 TaxID=3057615 RepID=UPI003524BAB2
MTRLMWPTTGTANRNTMFQEHTTAYGSAPGLIATAPATFLVIGEHTDLYGGIVLSGMSGRRVVVGASRRRDDTVRVRVLRNGTDDTPVVVTTSTTMEILSTHANLRSNGPNEPDAALPASPLSGIQDNWANRLGGVAWMMIQRQLISRETPGFDITIISDIPPGCGLGEHAAAETAFALGLADLAGHQPDAPLRTRIADVCTQAASLFGGTPPMRARHTTALRGGTGQVLSVIDYADGSVTQAPSPAPLSYRPYLVTVPAGSVEPSGSGVSELKRRGDFIELASRIYGVESLRLLPDSEERVIDWLETVHEVRGPEAQPPVAEAAGWMGFLTAETRRAFDCAAFLRSRRIPEALGTLSDSQAQMCAAFGLGSDTDALVRLCIARGAAVARAAHAGASRAVIAWFPSDADCEDSHDDAAIRLTDDGLLVIPLADGSPAAVDNVPGNWS